MAREPLEIRLVLHPDYSSEQLDRIEGQLKQLIQIGNKNMAGIQDVIDAATAQTDVVASAVAAFQGLVDQLQTAIDSGDPAAIQSAVDLINSNTQALADGVAAGTGAE